MSLSFLPSSELSIKVVVTCDDSVECTDEERSLYLENGDESHLTITGDVTRFTLKALSPTEREDAEARAGAYSRSELGRLLWSMSPSNMEDKARWHHALTDDERIAYSEYNGYLNRVYMEMIRSSLTHVNGVEFDADQINDIRPESSRVQTITELVFHIQRISLLGSPGK